MIRNRAATERTEALSVLMQTIWAHDVAGERVPCVEPEHGHLWLSEDRAEIEAATHRCRTCPALEACRVYVDQFPEPAGVWAGQSAAERKEHRQ